MSASSRKSPFIDVFAKSGLQLNNYEESWNILTVDQRIFQSNIKHFVAKTDNPRNKNYQNFKDFIESYLDDEVNFLLALLPTKNHSDNVISHSSNQDSLIKLLIEIESLQADVFDYLIMKTINYCEANNETTQDRQIIGITINVPTYIINQFRYQPKIYEPETLCKKLMELINSISSSMIIKEIILCFPDILSDSPHDGIVAELEDLLKNSDLISATLDSLSNLKFQDTNTERIVNYLFDKYEFINESDLPALVKFVLKSTIALNSKDLLNRLRLKLKLDEIQSENFRFLIYDAIREYFQISTQIVDLFLSLMGQNLLDKPNFTLKPLDFLIISLVYSLPQQFKTIDKLFKQMVIEQTKDTLEKLIKKVFEFGQNIMKDLFGSICLVGKSLISSYIPEISFLAQLVYKIGFERLDSKFRQSLINIMTEHIICSSGPARDNCLEVLCDLSENSHIDDDCPLVQFSMQIKTLLDYVEYFTLSQIRKIYFIICSVTCSSFSASSTRLLSTSSSRICFDNSLASNSLQDYLIILINKQLSSSELKFKQIGVIGALMMIKNMAIRSKRLHEDEPDESLNATSSSILISGLNSEIKNVWQMIMESSRSSPESLGLFEDDLSCLLKKDTIPESIETLIKENLREMTSNLFKLDLVYQKKLSFCQSKLASFKIGK